MVVDPVIFALDALGASLKLGWRVGAGFAVYHRGELVASGSIEKILAQVAANRTASIRVLLEHERAFRWLEAQHDLSEVTREGDRIRFGFTGSDERMAALVSQLAQRGHQPVWIEEHKPSLETAFLTMTKGKLQ